MGTPVVAVTALLHRYARRLDAGDLVGVADLFRDADVLVSGTVIGSGSAFVEQFLRDSVIVHPDGTPQTRHVVAQPTIEMDDDTHATVGSQFTVLQVGPGGAYVVMVGRHHDTVVEGVDGWRFASRDYGDITFVGDTSRHLRPPPEPHRPPRS
ncbi:MAG: nuclear transport factor 2 family protein [Gordonia paraffinivorans]